jgi:hypothetical protein
MSVLSSTADIQPDDSHFRFVPIGDMGLLEMKEPAPGFAGPIANQFSERLNLFGDAPVCDLVIVTGRPLTAN